MVHTETHISYWVLSKRITSLIEFVDSHLYSRCAHDNTYESFNDLYPQDNTTRKSYLLGNEKYILCMLVYLVVSLSLSLSLSVYIYIYIISYSDNLVIVIFD